MKRKAIPESRIRVLVVDDSEGGRLAIRAILSSSGYDVVTASDGEEGLQRVLSEPPDLIVTDLFMGNMSGTDLLRRVKDRHPHLPVIVVTGFPSVSTAVEALKLGASDYLVRPFQGDELRLVVERCLAESRLHEENARLRRALGLRGPAIPEFLGKSEAIRSILVSVDRLAAEDCPVMVVGESGTGKDLVARRLHCCGPRRSGPYLAINCGAVPESLFESELFGHKKGAFTSADSDQIGAFEAASGGTLFLDEIESTTLRVQAKLLRAVEDRAVVPVGSVQARQVDTRLVFSSQGGLREKAMEGSFRQDLFYRINVVELYIPPLRERREDIPVLIDHFLLHVADGDGRSPLAVSSEAMRAILEYNWPGNVRELEHALERASLFAQGKEIRPEDLPSEILRTSPSTGQTDPSGRRPTLKEAAKDFEREYIAQVVSEAGGDKRLAAEILDVDLSTLYRKSRD